MVQTTKYLFRRALARSGLADRIPNLYCASRKAPPYGVPLSSFPAGLQHEVEALLKCKQDPYAYGRPRKGRIRAVTAARLKQFITRLYGFATKIEKRKDVTSLSKLVTKKTVISFVNWALQERKQKGESVAGSLGCLCAAMRWNPTYETYDFNWLRSLIAQIEPAPASEKDERKANKSLPYEVLENIPALIHAGRKEVVGSRAFALLVHDELLFSWLVTLVWRQRNIRECCIGSNLFKAEIPTLSKMAIPRWVQDRLRLNPHEQFWQIRFREGDTKTKHTVQCVLPQRLVPLLEEYLEHHRPILLRHTDPGTLFLNRNGRPLACYTLNVLVSSLTLRYARRRVTPHLIRDIFANYWLDYHPEDYLTVSKVLWHKDIKTTLHIYGRGYEESHGLRRVEEWLDNRDKGAAQIMQATGEKFSEFTSEYSPALGKIQPAPVPHSPFRKKAS
jgi:integrase